MKQTVNLKYTNGLCGHPVLYSVMLLQIVCYGASWDSSCKKITSPRPEPLSPSSKTPVSGSLVTMHTINMKTDSKTGAPNGNFRKISVRKTI